MTSLTSATMTSLTPLLDITNPRCYDVTNPRCYVVTNPPLLWRTSLDIVGPQVATLNALFAEAAEQLEEGESGDSPPPEYSPRWTSPDITATLCTHVTLLLECCPAAISVFQVFGWANNNFGDNIGSVQLREMATGLREFAVRSHIGEEDPSKTTGFFASSCRRFCKWLRCDGSYETVAEVGHFQRHRRQCLIFSYLCCRLSISRFLDVSNSRERHLRN